jgi:hypothetical protein
VNFFFTPEAAPHRFRTPATLDHIKLSVELMYGPGHTHLQMASSFSSDIRAQDLSILCLNYSIHYCTLYLSCLNQFLHKASAGDVPYKRGETLGPAFGLVVGLSEPQLTLAFCLKTKIRNASLRSCMAKMARPGMGDV